MHIPIRLQTHDRSRGDTMVEVLIAIAVVAVILGGAYVTTNRSLLATRAAQERAVALKLAESQIERLKGLVATTPELVTAMTSPFCIAASGQPVADDDDACAVDGNGNPAQAEPKFHLSINEPSENYYVLTETWFNVRGTGSDSLQLRYRVYE